MTTRILLNGRLDFKLYEGKDDLTFRKRPSQFLADTGCLVVA